MLPEGEKQGLDLTKGGPFQVLLSPYLRFLP